MVIIAIAKQLVLLYSSPDMTLLTTHEVAERLGVSTARIRAMISAGRLKAEKFGHVHMIHEEDLASVAERKAGRPPKNSDGSGESSTATNAPDDGAPGAAIGEEKPVRKVRKKGSDQ